MPAAGSASTYTNPAPIELPNLGPAATYPSTLSVSGLPDASGSGNGLVVRVTLRGLQHFFPDDLDVLLVGPSAKTMLMSDACGDPDVNGLELVFEDAAPGLMLDTPAGSCGSDRVRPTDYEPGDVMPAPAPPGSYPAQLAVFGPGSPNGLWQLFINDDTGGLDGTLAFGWSLELLPVAYCGEHRFRAVKAENTGTAGNDVLKGTAAPDVLFGFGGNDTIIGRGGNDVICGGPGKDTLKGGNGRDYLRGEQGKDKLKGEAGKDTCNGGSQKDSAAGSCEKTKDV